MFAVPSSAQTSPAGSNESVTSDFIREDFVHGRRGVGALFPSRHVKVILKGGDEDPAERLRHLDNWINDLDAELARLAMLEPNWDAEGAQVVSEDTIESALESVLGLLERVKAVQNLPVPAAIPTHSGGVQLEWHVGDKDVTLAFEPEGTVEFYHFDHHVQTPESGDLTLGEETVVAALDDLASRVGQTTATRRGNGTRKATRAR